MDSNNENKRFSKLEIQNLHIAFRTSSGIVNAVRGIDLTIRQGQITALLGESGSGKSVTALSVMNLLPFNGRVAKGRILLDETDLLQLSKKSRGDLCGKRLGMIFQDPVGSLDPLFSIGSQMAEGILRHRRVSRRQALHIAERYLEAMHLRDAGRLLKLRPFELSGGMCQRVMIAMTMALEPDFLIADEPTTALDVTVQQQILRELYRLCRAQGVGILFITHDLGVVAEIADEVYVMKDGQIVESGNVYDVYSHPVQPYTRKLMASIL